MKFQTPTECLAAIRDRQIKNMPIPPESGTYLTDLGLFLVYFQSVKPNQEVILMDCEFLGLLPREDALLLVAKARFELDEIPEPIVTKGCFFTELEGDALYDSIPAKGEPLNIRTSIPEHFFRENAKDDFSVRLLRGKYKEEFLPLVAHELEIL